MRSFSFYSLQLLYLLYSETIALCFWPDGHVSDDLECNPNANETACCERGSTCLSNGICKSTNSSGIAIYSRGSCTDSTWRSTLCPQFCQSVSENAAVYYCVSEENWCCDQNLVYQGCCANAINFLDLGVGTSLTVVGGSAATTTPQSTSFSIPSSSTAVSTEASSVSGSSTAPSPSTGSQPITPSQSSTVSTIATQPAAAAASPSKSNDPGAKIGAGVGVPLGVALLAAISYILFLHRSRSHSTHLLRHLRSHEEKQKDVQEQPLFPMSSSSHGYGLDEMPKENDPTSIEMPQLHGQARPTAQLPA